MRLRLGVASEWGAQGHAIGYANVQCGKAHLRRRCCHRALALCRRRDARALRLNRRACSRPRGGRCTSFSLLLADLHGCRTPFPSWAVCGGCPCRLVDVPAVGIRNPQQLVNSRQLRVDRRELALERSQLRMKQSVVMRYEQLGKLIRFRSYRP